MSYTAIRLLRYPGGKQRLIDEIINYLPLSDEIEGKYVEPFVGGAAVFFAINPKRAFLSDLNSELIDLYSGLQSFPDQIWENYCSYPSTKKGYYKIRDLDVAGLDLISRAARTLYLNRTCFKGMWRHNAEGKFNVGYGGEARRWVITREDLLEASERLQIASLHASDFQHVIENCSDNDFLFLDPPYKPGRKELAHNHYTYQKFTYNDYTRLATTLDKATRRGVKWAMTISSHPDILTLFEENYHFSLKQGTGESPGILTSKSGEVFIRNYPGRKQK